ncbi:ABC transporter permease [Microtetraspora fusca]|uniref:ABC transporter permease n=1 Tax=Microtetraspora fusca TaxID=1997 RepID=A0ABW6VB16_MICFU|nr:ABC transporter permease [Microtetraspora fusca]
MTDTTAPAASPARARLSALRPSPGLRQSLIAIALGLLASLIIIAVIADEPMAAFRAFALGSFEDVYSFGTMLSIATILAITGLSSAIGFKAGAFNIGGEGQLYAGGLTAAVVALYMPGPGPVVMVTALVAAAVVGAAWIAIPALLRVYFGVTEIVTTLMSTYIAIDVTTYLVKAYFKDPQSGALETPPIPQETWLPGILSPSNANYGLFLAVLLAGAMALFLARTRLGLRLRLVGLQPSFAENVGIASDRTLLGGMLTSGALAGLAGGVAILGLTHNFIDSFSPQFGFLGITVALIGRLSPFGVLAAAVLYGSLMTGATSMQSVSDVPFALVFILQGLLILLITSQGIRRRGAM